MCGPPKSERGAGQGAPGFQGIIAPASLAKALEKSIQAGGLFSWRPPKPVVRRTNSDGNVLH